jgi:hypothetical protein
MRGELWRLSESGGGFEVWYNKDVKTLATGIKAKDPFVLGLIFPSAVREILARIHLWETISTETLDWTAFAMSLSGEPIPSGDDDGPPSKAEIEEWIDNALERFCRTRGRFVERISAMEDGQA